MPELTIDGRRVTVPEGATVLEAARRLGIPIPTLCHRDGFEPSTSCMVCVVKDLRTGRLVPSCTAPAADGMEIESETDEVREARRLALELLLSDHPADCLGPCETVCPAGMAIPRMIRHLAAGETAAAAAVARRALVLPATLGRLCPAPCEKGCRRGRCDAPVAIRLLHRRAAEADLAAGTPDLPAPAPATGRRVAVVGAGPTGLAAAWHLALAGHAVTVFEKADAAGGTLRPALARWEEETAPAGTEGGAGTDGGAGPAAALAVLDAEVGLIERLGVAFRLGTRVGRDVALADLLRPGGGSAGSAETGRTGAGEAAPADGAGLPKGRFDAVLVACGRLDEAEAAALGLPTAGEGLAVNRRTMQTPLAGVFAAGEAVRPMRLAVRAVADGAAAAACIDRFLRGEAPAAPSRPFTARLGRPEEDELAELLARASAEGRVEPAGGPAVGFTAEEAEREARRCLRCDCRAADTCLLRRWAEAYGARPGRHAGTRRRVRIFDDHPRLIYEPAKCISCGLCIQVCRRRGERLGLAWVGRGFDVRVGVPFGKTLAEALSPETAAECAAVCPTGALVLKEEA